MHHECTHILRSTGFRNDKCAHASNTYNRHHPKMTAPLGLSVTLTVTWCLPRSIHRLLVFGDLHPALDLSTERTPPGIHMNTHLPLRLGCGLRAQRNAASVGCSQLRKIPCANGSCLGVVICIGACVFMYVDVDVDVDVDWDEKVNVYACCVTRVELFVCKCGCDHVRVRGLNLACRSERAVVCVCVRVHVRWRSRVRVHICDACVPFRARTWA